MLKQKRQAKPHTPRSWIEANFQKRDCVKFIPFPKDESICCCGQSRTTHPTIPGIEPGTPADTWLPFKHTRAHPTDAYGTIEFQGGAHPTKAQYVRLSYDTRPDLLVQLFTKEWNLELPKLLITVQGGKANFELQPKLKKEIRKGLLKAAKTTGAWIFTGGTNTGVTKQVGDALLLEGQQRTGRVVSIGIAPWGIVERNHELLGHNRDVPCHSISSPRSKLAVLNNRHAYFLLVDNGTQGKYGAELILRRKLEKFISNLKLHPFTHSSTPVVCLVIEGGTNTIRAVLEYVTDTPPVPVVVCDGSGRAADLIAFVHKYAADGQEQTVLESMREYLINTIQKTFEIGTEQAECLYQELLQCTRNKNLITVYRIQEKPEGEIQELDQTILTALFKSQHLSPPEQLSLALTWNRVDIARSEIFVYGQEWPYGALDEAMMQALEHDRIDFVKLLLENGVSMKKFLTIPRLEELYNTKHGPANTLQYILRDVRPHIPKGYVYTLHDIGLVINKLMGGAYRSYYTRRKFRPIYAKVMNSYVNTYRKSSTFQRHPGANSMSLVTGLLPFTSEMALFEFPFNELLIWAVLTKRQEMSLLMWAHGEESLAKSLVACKLYKAMAHEAAEDDLDTEIYDELKNYAKEFETKGIKLLDFCYRQDAERAQRLLTCELQSWSSQSCLSLAVAANHRPLLAHPCSQVILADLWMGGLRTRKNTNLKVMLGLLCPPFIKKLDFKSKEELQSMPQTEEEHLENQNLDYEDLDKNVDAENTIKRKRSVAFKCEIGRQSSTQALLAETLPMKDTKVQENGKVSLTESDTIQKDFLHISYDYEVKQHRPLRLKKKIYEFYTAPITKFWADAMAYMIFLLLFSYTVLVKMEITPTWQEVYSIAYITTLGCEKIREIISSEPVAISHKFSVWAWNMWNPCDAAAIVIFLVGLVLRFKPNTMAVGRVIFCVDIIYWYLRILNILGVNKYLGPLVTMMGKMVKNMIYFVVLLLVVLLSFGVSRQAILYPHEEASWHLIRDVYFQPYFMLYGEVFADEIDPPCGEDPSQPECVTGRWVTPVTMSMYLLIANILLINLLIAVFNNIFIEVNAVAHQVWMFQRFTVVMEYQQKPVFPPPLIAFSHCYSLFKYFLRKAKDMDLPRDNGLKLFLEKEDMERLYDFEEECVEGYFREQEIELNQSTEERIKATTDRVETMAQKIEDINQKENIQTATVQNIDFRLRKVEENAEQILQTLAVIHRFMSTHTTSVQDNLGGSSGNIILDNRLRAASENEGTNILQVQPRKRFNRSLTEVRPDTNLFDEGLNFDVRRTVHEEEDEQLQSPDRKTQMPTTKLRKQSTMSVDSDDMYASGKASSIIDVSRKHSQQLYLQTPFQQQQQQLQHQQSQEKQQNQSVSQLPILNITRQETESTESKDTLTPLDFSEELTLIDDNASIENIIDLNYESAKQRAINRRSGGGGVAGRRNSEILEHGDVHRSQTSLNATRRQLSLTQSEPDSGNEQSPAKSSVKSSVKSKSNRGMLLQFHTEYTSITDELESVCHMISSPTVSVRDQNDKQKKLKAMTNAEFAALIEKQHLKECEENDYVMLSRLFQNRCSIDDTDESFDGASSMDLPHHRLLRRETAIELPITPLKGNATKLVSGNCPDNNMYVIKNERIHSTIILNRNLSTSDTAQYPKTSPPTYLMSQLSEPHGSTTFVGVDSTTIPSAFLKKSTDSLQKNSSTETEYSLHPYKVIKQNSNDTNTSINSSFNVDNLSSYTCGDVSLDIDQSLNATVIEIPIIKKYIGGGGGGSSDMNVHNKDEDDVDDDDDDEVNDGDDDDDDDDDDDAADEDVKDNENYNENVRLKTVTSQPKPIAGLMKARTITIDDNNKISNAEEQNRSLLGNKIVHPHLRSGPPILRKQFSMDQGQLLAKIADIPTSLQQQQQQQQQQPPSSSSSSSSTIISSSDNQPLIAKSTLKPPIIQSILPSVTKLTNTLKGSSSTSTDESKDERNIPQISTIVIQDEIAKLSSNIKSSTEDEKDPPFNETMC